jgi:hypothetical protein
MRTKTLLLTAALSAAGIATSMAQVYSVNAVGYINVPVLPGFNLIANQLNRTGGNSLNALFGASATLEDQVFKFTAGNYTSDIYDGSAFVDSISGDPSTTLLDPGEGAFYYDAGAAKTITLVGEVPQGTLNLSLSAGFSLVSSKVPQSAALDTIGLSHRLEAQYITYSATLQGYNTPLIDDGGTWLDSITGDPASPIPRVGEGFFLYNPGPGDLPWNRTFSVNP